MKTIISQNKLAAYFCFALLLYMLSYLAGTSAKFSNNIMYAAIGVPVILCSLLRWRESVATVRSFIWVFVFFAAVLVAEVFAPNGSFGGSLRHCFYLSVLVLAIPYFCRRVELLRAALLIFGLCALVYVVIASAMWLGVFFKSGKMPRVHMNDVNVTHISLLCLMGLMALWLMWVEEKLKNTPHLLYFAALMFFCVLCVATIVVFQSRSTLIAFLLFLFVYAAFRKKLAEVLVAVGLCLLVLWLSDLYQALLTRGGSYRLAIWNDVIASLSTECNFLSGCGAAADRIFAGQFLNPHSGYLATLYYQGVIGLFAFAIMAWKMCRTGWRERSPFFLLALTGWGGAFASSAGFIQNPEPQWVYFWIPNLIVLYLARQPRGHSVLAET